MIPKMAKYGRRDKGKQTLVQPFQTQYKGKTLLDSQRNVFNLLDNFKFQQRFFLFDVYSHNPHIVFELDIK